MIIYPNGIILLNHKCHQLWILFNSCSLTDNGALGTVELRLPVPWISGENRLFQVVPFIDGGVAWNSHGEEVEGSNALAAVGLGLQVSLWDKINMRLDYGIPLVDVNSRDQTAQEEGFYFSVSATPFSF